MAEPCGNKTQNPSQACGKDDGMLKRIILLETGTTFATQEEAKTYAAHTTNIQAGAEIPFPKHLVLEDVSSGVANEQTPLGIQNVTNGTVEYKCSIPANAELYKKIYSYRGTTQYGVIFQTDTGNLVMNKDSDGIYSGFTLDMLNVENQTTNDGSVGTKAPVHISLDVNEWNENRVVFKPSFNPNRLTALKDVVFNMLSASSTVITFTINEFSDNDDIEAANLEYGWVVADLELLDVSGGAQVIGVLSGGTTAETGVYTLTGTGYVSGTLGGVNPADMTTTGYSTYTVGTVTVA